MGIAGTGREACYADVTSLAKDLDDHSMWFFDAKPDDAPRWHEIAERLRDLSKYGGAFRRMTRRSSVGIALSA